MSKRKFLMVSLMVICITSSFNPVYALSETDVAESTEYINIFSDSKEEKSENKNDEKLMGSAVIGGIYNDKSMTNGIDSAASLSSTPYNVGIVYDYIGFNTSYVFSHKIRGYAKTKVTGLNLFDPIPEWTLYVSGNLYKNYSYLYGMPSTTGYEVSDVRTDSPYDYNPSSGDQYQVNSYHRVYDYYGTKIWDNSHYRTKTY